MDILRFACAWVDACLPVNHHGLSLALTGAPARAKQHQHHRPGLAPLFHQRFLFGIAER
jgi:hypothetical protein